MEGSQFPKRRRTQNLYQGGVQRFLFIPEARIGVILKVVVRLPEQFTPGTVGLV
jgi:hypothetical protein